MFNDIGLRWFNGMRAWESMRGVVNIVTQIQFQRKDSDMTQCQFLT